ncbi:hypothetical protein BH09DEP1_BH09DEP1_0120 [soil metagenome]
MKKIFIVLLLSASSLSYSMDDYSLESMQPLAIASSSPESYSPQRSPLNNYASADIKREPGLITVKPEPLEVPPFSAEIVAFMLGKLQRQPEAVPDSPLLHQEESSFLADSEDGGSDTNYPRRRPSRARTPGRYECETCFQVFKWSWGVSEHRKYSCTESSEYLGSKYMCRIPDCNHISKRKSDLKRHESLPHPLKKLGKKRQARRSAKLQEPTTPPLQTQ